MSTCPLLLCFGLPYVLRSCSALPSGPEGYKALRSIARRGPHRRYFVTQALCLLRLPSLLSPRLFFLPLSCHFLSRSMLQQASAPPGQGPIPQQCMDTGLALQTACAEEVQKAGAALGVGTGNGVAMGGQASAVDQKKLDAFIADPKNDPSPA